MDYPVIFFKQPACERGVQARDVELDPTAALCYGSIATGSATITLALCTTCQVNRHVSHLVNCNELWEIKA